MKFCQVGNLAYAGYRQAGSYRISPAMRKRFLAPAAPDASPELAWPDGGDGERHKASQTPVKHPHRPHGREAFTPPGAVPCRAGWAGAALDGLVPRWLGWCRAGWAGAALGGLVPRWVGWSLSGVAPPAPDSGWSRGLTALQ